MITSQLRRALEPVSFPIGVVTTIVAGKAHATTVSSFCTVLSQSPSVILGLNRRSDLLPLVLSSQKLALNLLPPDSLEIAEACAQKGAGKLDKIPWEIRCGFAVLEAAVAWLTCEVTKSFDADEHVVLFSRVKGVGPAARVSADA